SVMVEDFNQDGRIDIASTAMTQTRAALLLNSGDGGFTTQHIELHTVPSAADVCDFNQDGVPDLVTLHPIESEIRISVLQVLKTKFFNFVFKADEHVFAIDEMPKLACVSDVDHDGDADLVALMP